MTVAREISDLPSQMYPVEALSKYESSLMVSEYAIWRENNEGCKAMGPGRTFYMTTSTRVSKVKPGFFLFLEPREAESLPLPTMENQGNYGDMLFTGSLIEGH
jgi:hypothetical protein